MSWWGLVLSQKPLGFISVLHTFQKSSFLVKCYLLFHAFSFLISCPPLPPLGNRGQALKVSEKAIGAFRTIHGMIKPSPTPKVGGLSLLPIFLVHSTWLVDGRGGIWTHSAGSRAYLKHSTTFPSFHGSAHVMNSSGHVSTFCCLLITWPFLRCRERIASDGMPITLCPIAHKSFALLFFF